LGLASLAGIFGLPPKDLDQSLVAALPINWVTDPFARGAYIIHTLYPKPASAIGARKIGPRQDFVVLALHRGRDMGTIEQALASGLETARTILAADRIATI